MAHTPTRKELDDWRDTELMLRHQAVLNDRRERRRQRLQDMGFGDQAIREQEGVVVAYMEDASRRFHGVDPHATDRKSGRKRKRDRQSGPKPLLYRRVKEANAPA